MSKNNIEEVMWKKAVRGLGLAWLTTAVGLLLGSTVIYWGWLSPSWLQGAAKVIMVVSMFVGGFYVFRSTTGRDRVWVLAVLVAYLFVRFLLSLILTF